ncbi:MAG: hypothetical protein U0836_08810 [Pirellulales bacterium]
MATLSTLPGCGKSEGMLPVTGSVKFEDGSVPKGEASGYVEFAPVAGTAASKGATGIIDKETGEFELYTTKPGDGVLPGSYSVTLRVNATYPPKQDGSSSVVPLEYTTSEKTPLTAEVDAGHTRFDFKIPKRGAAGKKKK